MDKQEILLNILREISKNGLEEQVYKELHISVMEKISTTKYELKDYLATLKAIRKLNNKKNMAIENLAESCELLSQGGHYKKFGV